MADADDDNSRRDGDRAAPSAPLFMMTESDLDELEVAEPEIWVNPPPSETRALLDSLQEMLSHGKRRVVLSGALLGGLVAGSIIVLFILKLGLNTTMTRSAAIETAVIASTITALFTFTAVEVFSPGRHRINDWVVKFKSSLR